MKRVWANTRTLVLAHTRFMVVSRLCLEFLIIPVEIGAPLAKCGVPLHSLCIEIMFRGLLRKR